MVDSDCLFSYDPLNAEFFSYLLIYLRLSPIISPLFTIFSKKYLISRLYLKEKVTTKYVTEYNTKFVELVYLYS